MRVGISIGTTFGADEGREGAQTVIAQAKAANRAGLDLLCIGDHHVTAPASYLQNTPMLGRLLAEWDDRPAGCLFLVPLWHPVLMAEQIGTLASIAAGPFVVQVGGGGGAQTFAAMGTTTTARARRLDEGIATVQALLRGETATSELYGIHGARVAPLPPQGVEWWIGAAAPPAVDRAARLGDCWYGNADLTPSTAAAVLATYREACARHDRVPSRFPIRKDVFVAESRAEAERVGDALIEAGYRGFSRAAVAYGDPETVAEQLSVYGDLGFTDVMIRTMAPLPPELAPDAAARSVELCGAVRARLA